MKCLPLFIAALVPFAVTAAEQAVTHEGLDHQQLGTHVQASSMLGATVQSSDGQDVGVVEDIVFDTEGSISTVLVRYNDVDNGNNNGNIDRTETGARQMEADWEERIAENETGADNTETGIRERSSNMAEARAERRERVTRDDGVVSFADDGERAGNADQRLAELHWREVSYHADANVLRIGNGVTLQQAAQQEGQYEGDSEHVEQEGIRASSLMGVEVDLSNEASFGEVEDVLIDTENGKATALIVDTMEFFDKEQYALPFSLQNYEAGQDRLTLQLSQQQVEDMGEY